MSQQIALAATPDILAAIDASPRLADSSKRKYRAVIAAYLERGGSMTDAQALAAYAASIPKSSRGQLKAAVKLWAEGIIQQINSQAIPTPEGEAAAAATERRLRALVGAIHAPAPKGEKSHTWLSQAEVKRLFQSCDESPLGRRDRVVLALLVGAGLRRAEAAELTFDRIGYQPVGERFRTVLDVTGKGAKDRVIPLSDTIAAALDRWAARVGGVGRIARSVDKGGNLGDSLSDVGIFKIVRERGALVGRPELAAHDLRRTYAQIGYEAGVPVTQISKLLGHANLATTQRYLNLELDLESTISDYIPFE